MCGGGGAEMVKEELKRERPDSKSPSILYPTHEAHTVTVTGNSIGSRRSPGVWVVEHSVQWGTSSPITVSLQSVQSRQGLANKF